jgi:hypothetical protein
MESVGFRCPVGFKNYPPHLSVSTGTATSEGGRGVVPPSTVLGPTSMNESDTQRQEFGAQSVNYSAVGKHLLRDRLERDGADLGTRLSALAKIAGEGEFGVSELEELYQLQQQLNETVALIEDVGGLNDAKTMRERFEGGATGE